MQKKIWIGLEGIEFYAYHGVYEEERIIGGKYILDISVYTVAEKALHNDDLNGTVNYELLYNIAKKNMQQPVKLIEHLAQKILNDIRKIVNNDDVIKIKLKKIHPPLGAEVQASFIELED